MYKYQWYAIIGLLVSSVAHGQQLPTRLTVMEWVDNSDTAIQTCIAQSADVGDDHAILGGRIYVEDDSYDAEARPDAVYLSYSDHTGTHRDQIAFYDRYSDEFHGNEWLRSLGVYPDWYIEASDLSHTIEAESVRVETVSPAEEAIWYNAGAVVDLAFVQWLAHWCVDEDNDRYCDLFTASDDRMYSATPPMRAPEQVELAKCLDSHRNTKVVVVKADYQISGAANYPEMAQWTADCPDVPQTVVPTPEKIESPNRTEYCRLFSGWLYGNDVPDYLCDAALMPEGSKLSGHQIRSQMDRARGQFPGFNCPAASAASTNTLTGDDLRFDTMPLTRPLQRSRSANGTPRLKVRGATKHLQ